MSGRQKFRKRDRLFKPICQEFYWASLETLFVVAHFWLEYPAQNYRAGPGPAPAGRAKRHALL